MSLAPVLLCDAVRTPFGRYGGALAPVRTDDLASVPLAALQARHPQVDWAALDDVVLGCANQSGEDNRNVARMALLLAGLPVSVPGVTINRLCGSSLDAIASAARQIACGDADLLIAGGVEGMSRSPYVIAKADTAFGRRQTMEDSTLGWRFVNPAMRQAFGTDSMAETAENVAAEHHVSREDQDAFAYRSQQRTAAAVAAGTLADELVPVTVRQKKGPIVVAADEHPRPDTTLEGLARLAPITRPSGTITAGNASGINDGAGAVLLASEAAAARHGLTPSARIVASAAAGVPPRVMGLGPIPATKRLLARTGLTLADVDLFEINEAFAAQVLACLRALGVADDAPHVNPNGGAIALGHPLGASGVRLVASALYQLRRTRGRYAVCTMCIGVGQGMALLLERI
ncbi:MAG TPA: 3-oxoadipyl-CoA thiolase [Vicinamibacterales bacterium]|jgi:3-oxoadipyl-CoA thiolase|nr:3-oxoadipyl-CoA thiolase [Vicinamibacterales bacterium]